MGTRIEAVVHDGVAVPKEPLNLPDGTPVTIELGAAAGLLQAAGAWKDDPGIDMWVREREEQRKKRVEHSG